MSGYLLPARVECYAGSRADETPRAVWVDGERREVREVVDCWYQGTTEPTAGSAECFRLRMDVGQPVLLRHDLRAHAWFVVAPRSVSPRMGTGGLDIEGGTLGTQDPHRFRREGL